MIKRKILVIRYRPLKEFIECVPAFAAIRKYHKNDEIHILTERDMVKFCKRSKFFDKVWLDSKPEWFQPKGFIDLMRRLKAMKFDMVYDLQNNERSQWYFRLIGFRKPNWNSSVITWCTHSYKPEENEIFLSRIHNQIKVAGITSTPLIDIAYMADNTEIADVPEKIAMICAGGDRNKPYHKWDPVKYAEVIDYLYEKHGIESILIGDANNDAMLNRVISSQCIKTKPLDFSGRTSINGIIAAAGKALFCLGNDTAPTHIAAYAGCKTIMLCSEFSPVDTTIPKVKNVAVIEEPLLENVETARAINAIEEFGLVREDFAAKPFKVAGEDSLQTSQPA